MPIIDTHHHLWEFGRYDYGWIQEGVGPLGRNYLPADLVATLEPVGVTHAVLVQTIHSFDETVWFCDLADATPCIRGVVGYVDFDANRDAQLDQLAQRDLLKGIRHVIEGMDNDDWVVREDVIASLDELQRRGLTYDLLVRTRHLKHVPTLAQKLPDLPMVIDHIAKPPIKAGELDPWRDAIRAAAECPNIWCKLSGMVTEADHHAWQPADLKPYVDHILDVFGVERLMFGSDWPVCLLAGSYERMYYALRECVADLSEAEQDRIFAGSAIEFYRLSV